MARCSYCDRPCPNPTDVSEGSRYTSTGLVVCSRQRCALLYAVREARRVMDLPGAPTREERAVNDARQPTIPESVDERNDSLTEYGPRRETDQ